MTALTCSCCACSPGLERAGHCPPHCDCWTEAEAELHAAQDGPTLGPMPLDKQTASELSRAASNVRTWTEKRNNLIRDARVNGAGLREIARACGLNEATVHNIITPRNRGSNG